MPRLRILHVVPYYDGAWAYGGIPRAVETLCRAQADAGHQVTVCTTDAQGPDERRTRPASFGNPAVWVFPNWSNRLAFHWQAFAPAGMLAFLDKHAPGFDVAHIHGMHHLPGVLARRVFRRCGLPYFLSPHGTAPLIERRRTLKWLFDATLGRHMLTDAAGVLGVSRVELHELEGLGTPASKLSLVPNAIDLESLGALNRESARTELGWDNAPRVLFLGKITPRKELGTLIEAFAGVSVSNAKLIVAGNDLGGLAEARHRAVRLGLQHRVAFVGYADSSLRRALLSAADVVAYPGRSEVFGLTAMESLACGTPVVVADDHGCGEWVTALGAGPCVPPGQVDPLAAALSEVLLKPALFRARARRASHLVREWFSPEVVAAQTSEIYARVLGASTPRRRSG